MLYSPLIKKAMLIAYDAHDGQLDRGGYPYFAHVLRVAEMCEDEVTTSVALLHDVLEDTDITAEYLRANKIPENVIDAVVVLTHDKNVSYDEYLQTVKQNDIARYVKMRDLKHNYDLARLKVITDKDEDRAKKYEAAYVFLQLS